MKFLIPITISLIIASGCQSKPAEQPKKDFGPGPCYESGVDREFVSGLKPEITPKGKEMLKSIEQELGLSLNIMTGFSEDSTGKTCRTLDFVYETTNFNLYIKLDTSGMIDKTINKIFPVFLSECRNKDRYKEVFVRFMVGKDEKYEEYMAEQYFTLDLYQDSVYQE